MTQKNTPALLLLLFIAAFSRAQPIIQNNIIPNVGDKVYLATSDTNAVAVGNAGANQTWNFSALASLDSIIAYTYVTPASTPYAAAYPGATLVARWSSAGETTYGFEREEASQFLILGTRSASLNQTYINPDAQLKYPTAFNGTYQDDYSYTTDVGSGFPFLSVGSHDVKYDAYGTMTTPYGTFPNTMRIKAVTTQKDSADFLGTIILNYHNYTTYDWFVANQPGAVVSVSYFNTTTETRIPGFDTLFTVSGPTKSVHYIASSTVGVFDAPQSPAGLSEFSVGPNPASDQLTLRFQAEQTCVLNAVLTDINGKVLQARQATANTGENQIHFSVADLPAGAYFLTLSDGKRLQSWPWHKL